MLAYEPEEWAVTLDDGHIITKPEQVVCRHQVWVQAELFHRQETVQHFLVSIDQRGPD